MPKATVEVNSFVEVDDWKPVVYVNTQTGRFHYHDGKQVVANKQFKTPEKALQGFNNWVTSK